MKIVGVIGGIGSGKSMIVELLKSNYNAYVIKSDDIGHNIISKGTKSYKLIVNYFGNEILQPNFEINRAKLGDIVFNDSDKLKTLNSFTHPFIYDKIKEEINKVNSNTILYDFIVIELPLIIDSIINELIDEIWYINSDINIRKQRLLISRNITEDKINSIIHLQNEETQFLAIADYIIDNSGSIDNTIIQINKIFEKE